MLMLASGVGGHTIPCNYAWIDKEIDRGGSSGLVCPGLIGGANFIY